LSALFPTAAKQQGWLYSNGLTMTNRWPLLKNTSYNLITPTSYSRQLDICYAIKQQRS